MSDLVDWTMTSPPTPVETAVVKSKRRTANGVSKKRAPKLRESCDECSNAKVKCSKDKPTCTRCQAKDRTCSYGLSARSGRRQAKAPSTRSAGSTTSRTTTSSRPSVSYSSHGGTDENILLQARCSLGPTAQRDIVPKGPDVANMSGTSLDGKLSPNMPREHRYDMAVNGQEARENIDDFVRPQLDTTIPSTGNGIPQTDVESAFPAQLETFSMQQNPFPSMNQPSCDLFPMAESAYCPRWESDSALDEASDPSIFDDIQFDEPSTSSPSIFSNCNNESFESPLTSAESCDPASTIFEEVPADAEFRLPPPSRLDHVDRSHCARTCVPRIVALLNAQRNRSPQIRTLAGTDTVDFDRTLLDTASSALECGCLARDQRTCSLLMCIALDVLARNSSGDQKMDGNAEAAAKHVDAAVSFVSRLSEQLQRGQGCFVQWQNSPFVNFWKVTDHY